MSHDPERLAAGYLDGAVDDEQRRAFESHLLSCDSCWQEVRLARRGRRIAEEAREAASPQLRERIRATIAAERADPAARPARRGAGTRRPLLLVLAAALAAAAVAAGAVTTSRTRPAAQPGGLVAAAVTDYTAGRLPGSPLPARLAPDLAAVRLHLDGGGIGRGLTALDYRGPQGRHVAIYLTDTGIPAPPGAVRLPGPAMAWTAAVAGVRVLCVNTTLIVGRDPVLVTAVAHMLNLTS